jgi:hypothetical protein
VPPHAANSVQYVAKISIARLLTSGMALLNFFAAIDQVGKEEPAMEARRLIDSASFGPDTLKAIGQAFDEAWADIEGNFACDQLREAARLKLATAILSVASDDSCDVQALKKAGLEVMAKDYRWQTLQRATSH